ncbi:2-methylcitrate dehydratase [Methylacidimicrobium cyclopophantes]|uniref:2-methylcitrate dehydratase n=1 Tax=Methylacidimicrobium cyclopophantes TaxID=1041766 RepID=A0A5E6MGK3_9BACT|nr:bifunctional 2-methylcitrate dehydratase/aconitate hydratase [Methylacidimicrobium cyclopophantes]VVM07492.1 2-methylcitrate dehydratase [Methylacidimicrobium cyclopophantes]
MAPSDRNPSAPADSVLETLADYFAKSVDEPTARDAARLCLFDALGCGIRALREPECWKLLGSGIPGLSYYVPKGVPVPGLKIVLDPLAAARSIGTAIRWLDYNDTWLAAEWGHPSDNLGAILSAAYHASQLRLGQGKPPLTMRSVLEAMVQAYETQGVLSLENCFNRVGLDHTLLVRVASTAASCRLLGCAREETINALSNAWADGGSLRVYRHEPNVGWRKSWAAGDATSRGLFLAFLSQLGEGGYPTVLSAPHWGFCSVFLSGEPIRIPQNLGSFVIRNILFKVSYPTEFHAQTAVEAAYQLAAVVRNRWEAISRIEITTHEAALRIISKSGPLRNPADRDHCIQYAVAVALLRGTLQAEDFEEATASDPRIDVLREKMIVQEEKRFSKEYLDPNKRSIANSVQIFFADGTASEKVTVEYPLGHPKRRREALPLLEEKLKTNLATRFPARKVEQLFELSQDLERVEAMSVPEFLEVWRA